MFYICLLNHWTDTVFGIHYWRSWCSVFLDSLFFFWQEDETKSVKCCSVTPPGPQAESRLELNPGVPVPVLLSTCCSHAISSWSGQPTTWGGAYSVCWGDCGAIIMISKCSKWGHWGLEKDCDTQGHLDGSRDEELSPLPFSHNAVWFNGSYPGRVCSLSIYEVLTCMRWWLMGSHARGTGVWGSTVCPSSPQPSQPLA